MIYEWLYKKRLLLAAFLWLACICLLMYGCGTDKPAEIAIVDKQLPQTIDYNCT
jgi:hypothetical protein